MQRPFSSFFGVHLGYHSSESLMYSFDGTISLRMVQRHPNLGDSQEITQLRYHLPCELGRLIGHQAPGEPKHQKEHVYRTRAVVHAV